jgi:hypothetical protein
VLKHAQRRRHLEVRRRARARGRRPRLPKSSTLPHQLGARIRLGADAGPQPGRRAGVSSTSACSAGPCRVYSGCWVGFKTIAETVESSASVNVDPHQLDIVIPDDFALPPGGLNIRWPDPPLDAGNAGCTSTRSPRPKRSRAPTASTRPS